MKKFLDQRHFYFIAVLIHNAQFNPLLGKIYERDKKRKNNFEGRKIAIEEGMGNSESFMNN